MKTAVLIVAALLVGLVGQFFYFLVSAADSSAMNPGLKDPNAGDGPDTIIIFRGGNGRVTRGFDLLGGNQDIPLIISPATQSQIKRYIRQDRPNNNVNYLIEAKVRTTFENALYCSRLIKKHGFETIALVTSDYHMARSYLLLKTMLLGESVKIEEVAVDTPKYLTTVSQLKIAYNEMVDCWGSFGEMAFYGVFRQVPERPAKELHAIRWLKKVLLFNV